MNQNNWLSKQEDNKPTNSTNLLRAKLTSILNNITPQNFKDLSAQILELTIDNMEKIKITSELIFAKALVEPALSQTYAQLCKVLTTIQLPDEDNPKVSPFRFTLLNRCQKELFRKNDSEKLIEDKVSTIFANKMISAKQRKEKIQELLHKRSEIKNKMLGNIKFIGELYNLNMISTNIIQKQCINTLLEKKTEDNHIEIEIIECLTTLYTIAGQKLEQDHAAGSEAKKSMFEKSFRTFANLSLDKYYPYHIRFLIIDLVDLRENDWVPRRQEAEHQPIHREHAQKNHEKKCEYLVTQQSKRVKSKGLTMEIDEHTLKNIYPHSRGLEVMVDKTIVFLGDSVMRGMYKDMLKYVKCGDLLKESESKRKGEVSFQDDLLVYGGDKLAKKTNGKEFREYRVIKCDNGIILKYHYICRAYNDHVESILESFVTDPPDIVVVNSCLWDLHRYRSEKRAAMESFKENVLKLAGKLSSIRVPQYQSEAKPPLCIWTTTPPCSCDVPIIEDFTEVSDDPNAYNFTAQIDEINAANIWLGQMLPNYSFNIIDLGTVMAKAVHNREKDGVHWNAAANRMFSMLILSRVEMQLARPGKQKIPTVIYSPLLYVAPVAQPVAKQPIIQQPAPMPYQEHQYYDGMNEFNDRYSFKQTSSNDYYQDYNQEQRGGPQSGGPHFGGPHGPRGGPPPHHGPLHGGPGPRGPQDLYAEEDRFSDPYSSYTNSYNYNDIMGAVGEQRSMGSRGPVSQSRALQERRHMQAAAKQTQRTVSRIPPQQHRYPPSRHVPPPRQNRRTRPY